MATAPLPVERRYDGASNSVSVALRRVINALNLGGNQYPGYRQPVYPFGRLVTTFLQLPVPADAGAGAKAMITDSSIPAVGNFGVQVTPWQGGPQYTVPVWTDGTAWFIG